MSDIDIEPEDLRRMVGRTIKDACVKTTDALELTFDDGSTATIESWAMYAEDHGLTLELAQPEVSA